MGAIISFISSLFTQPSRMLILGLDSAGKTTILYYIASGQQINTVPTIGFNMEELEHDNVKFKVWDLGGQEALRPYWSCYYNKTNAVIFVVDSCDKERMNMARAELHKLAAEKDLQNAVIAIFANKQDMEGALSSSEISDKLMLHTIKSHTWNIFNTSAVTGKGLDEGMKWVAEKIKAK